MTTKTKRRCNICGSFKTKSIRDTYSGRMIIGCANCRTSIYGAVRWDKRKCTNCHELTPTQSPICVYCKKHWE